MNLKNIRAFIDAASLTDINYVAKGAGITYDYLLYHIATGRRVPSEDTAARIEKASYRLTRRKPRVPWLRCTDFISGYDRCPHIFGGKGK